MWEETEAGSWQGNSLFRMLSFGCKAGRYLDGKGVDLYIIEETEVETVWCMPSVMCIKLNALCT